MPFLEAANLYRRGKVLDNTCLLHCAFQESCHWAFCKLLMILNPSQVLQRDSDGNLPIHIITACTESSDGETFICLSCFLNKGELFHVVFLNGHDTYCCYDCLRHEPKEKVKEVFPIRPYCF